MIPFKTKLGSFKIPSNWSDLKMSDLQYLRDNIKDDVKIAERLTGLNIEQLAQIDVTPIRSVLDELFSVKVEDIEPKEYITVNDKDYLLPNVKVKTFFQKLEAFKAWQKGDVQKVLSIYLEPLIRGSKKPKPKKTEVLKKEFSKLTVQEFYSSFNYIESQLKELVKMEQDMPKPPTTPEQIEAGAESFNVLGDFNTVDLLAGGDVLKHEAIYMMPYITIYKKLFRNNLNSIFEDRYSKIMQRKANNQRPS
jgi:hypothetical protein